MPLQEALAKLSIHLEYFPSVEWLKRGITPDQLGLFEGVGAEDPMSYQIPRITLWLGNLWLVANGDIPAFLEEVRITFLHEVGHYLGLDENQLTDRDLY
ncbi:MAG: metallopeptidase family protein [Chthoniobacterales bacterium]|nr:metallopeptidase family protein [Chthoniobacterales bacterium]